MRGRRGRPPDRRLCEAHCAKGTGGQHLATGSDVWKRAGLSLKPKDGRGRKTTKGVVAEKGAASGHSGEFLQLWDDGGWRLWELQQENKDAANDESMMLCHMCGATLDDLA